MPASAKVMFQFNISKLEALNDLYNAISDVRKQHSGVDIRISSKQGDNDNAGFESYVTIIAEAHATTNHDAMGVMNAVTAISHILPRESLS